MANAKRRLTRTSHGSAAARPRPPRPRSGRCTPRRGCAELEAARRRRGRSSSAPRRSATRTRSSLQRVAADFDNYRKRQAREREQQAVAANERLVLDLLPVLDALERASTAFDKHDAEQVREGVAYVHRALLAALERQGVSEIDPHGKRFDPAEHEALTTQVVPGTDEGTVVQVIQRGFRLGDRVVRPARVIVAAAAPD